MAEAGGFGIFAVFLFLIPLLALSSIGLGVAALVSISRTPIEAFGPWWDNTRQTWLVGVAVSFVIPLGNVIAGIVWFSSGRAPLRNGQGYVARPFWSGPPKPPPPPGWVPPPPGWGPPPPPAPPPDHTDGPPVGS
jgi:hypothetical protein